MKRCCPKMVASRGKLVSTPLGRDVCSVVRRGVGVGDADRTACTLKGADSHLRHSSVRRSDSQLRYSTSQCDGEPAPSQ